ncbi:MAG: TIGR00730 family Rossman fold protein [Pseudoprimorskyibacter sp.]|jgi:uncharacterized protein (TIGR00730 family)|nr:TIGR00730 family Rossman fold protein [Pseudoprimorskyibacter sp.]
MPQSSTQQPVSICVYCGARDGDNPIYAKGARDLGHMIATAGWRLVYGAGDIGLMGRVARAAQAEGGETFGVIPTHLLQREVGKTDLTRFVVTETMHERKKVMLMNADAVVLLPGGAGSLDEVFEVLTWRQLGLHNKPVIVVNLDGYWDPLLALLDHVIDHGFADTSLRGYVTSVPDAEAAIDALRLALSSTSPAAE